MPIYTPKTLRTGFSGGKNILASEHLQFIEGAATLDASAFGAGYVEVGTAVARNTATGKYVPYAGAGEGDVLDNHSIMNVDWNCDGTNDGIIGELIVRGSVYEAKLPAGVDAGFKAANPLIRYVNHI